MPIPVDNPTTVEGVELGRKIFYDTRLSGDNTQACASCHMQEFSFSDSAQFSLGITGQLGGRQAPVLQNLGWSTTLFWDGRASSLEEQAAGPVVNPIEMNTTWPEVVTKLKADQDYPNLFFKAFGVCDVDSVMATKALAQFMRTMISGNAKFDQWVRGETLLTSDESDGFDLFKSFTGADCLHCHTHTSGLFTDFSFGNNGLDDAPSDLGRGGITGSATDNFKFKTPTLRNIEYSAPFMHDGRFSTLDEVINFYSDSIKAGSPNIHPLIEFAFQGGVQLSPIDKGKLKAFLLTLSDPDFINDPKFSDPN